MEGGGREVAPYEFSASPLNQFASPIPTYRQTDNEDVMLRYVLDSSAGPRCYVRCLLSPPNSFLTG